MNRQPGPGSDDGSEPPRRDYYRLAGAPPDVVRVVAIRHGLRTVRPHLAHVWLGTTPADGSWPPQLHEDAERLPALVAAQAAQPARRPGTGPDRLFFDATDDDLFDLALRLGPFAGTVVAMTRDGKLAVDIGPGVAQWRLTADELAAVTAALAEVAPRTWLVPGREAHRQPEAHGRGPLDWKSVLVAVVLAPGLIRHGITDLHPFHLSWSVVWAALGLAVGVGAVAVVVIDLVRAARRLLAARRASASPADDRP